MKKGNKILLVIIIIFLTGMINVSVIMNVPEEHKEITRIIFYTIALVLGWMIAKRIIFNG